MNVAETQGTGTTGAPGVAKRSATGAAAFVVVAVMILAAFSLWTVIPVGWLWIGSHVSDTQAPSGGPYMVTFVGILVSILVIVWVLGRLNHVYVRLTGGAEIARLGRAAWLKSMRDERASGHRTTVLEAIILTSVILAAIAATVLFLFYSGNPLPSY